MLEQDLQSLLAKPSAPRATAKSEKNFTTELEVSGDEASVTVRSVDDGPGPDGVAARGALARLGEDPANWVAVGVRVSEWTMPNGGSGTSHRFQFARRGTALARSAEAGQGGPGERIDGVLREAALAAAGARRLVVGGHSYVVALGDMQLGKVDGDGVEGTVTRTLVLLHEAADNLKSLRKRFDVGHVHVAWLGDHIEGFVSQGGANAWRTPLSLTDQLRLVRRTMFHALELFAPLAKRVTMAAVPGNHGEPQRFARKGVTTYDDSHDTEALVAVADAAKLNPKAFGHVEFYVPQTDEMTVAIDCSGTSVGHVHGHQWRPGQHMKWWQGQTFGGGIVGQSDVLLAGHLHHFKVDTSGRRVFLQVPALEAESTWWRHNTGEPGCPGLVTFITKDGRLPVIETLRGEVDGDA